MNSCPCQAGQTITPKGWQDTHPYAQDRPGPSSSPRRTHTPLLRPAAGTLQRKERRSPEPAQPICVPQTPPSRPRQAPGLRQQIFLASCSLSRSRRHRSPVPQPPRRSPVRRETWAEAAPSPHPPGQPVAPAGKGTGVRPLRSFLPPVLPARTSAARRTELPPAASARPGPAPPRSRGAISWSCGEASVGGWSWLLRHCSRRFLGGGAPCSHPRASVVPTPTVPSAPSVLPAVPEHVQRSTS